MAAPVIILRFRDTTPGTDTIAAHLELLDRHGAVWWGWWRKEHEVATALDVPEGPLEILLADRSTRRMFRAACERFSARGADIDQLEVPEYYRGHFGEIEGFFRLTRIEATAYDEDLGGRLGERTLMRMDEPGRGPAEHMAGVADVPGRHSILHLSDLHFGADYGFLTQDERPDIGSGRRTLTECVVADLERIGLTNDIAALIVTGDFMSRGDWKDRIRHAALKEFDALRDALRLTQQQIIGTTTLSGILRVCRSTSVNSLWRVRQTSSMSVNFERSSTS
jgi:hypothetical protein